MNDQQLAKENEAIDIVERYNAFTDKSENRMVLADLRKLDDAVDKLDSIIHSLAYDELTAKVLEEFIRTKTKRRFRDTSKDVLYKFCDYYSTIKQRHWDDYRESLAKDKAEEEAKANAKS
mgnify:CR=1 FL=1